MLMNSVQHFDELCYQNLISKTLMSNRNNVYKLVIIETMNDFIYEMLKVSELIP